MRVTALGLVAGLLLPCAAALAGSPQTAKPKDGDYVKFEARGTIQKSPQAVPADEDVFVPGPNPCAGGFLFEKEMEAYEFRLASARLQPRLFRKPLPAAKATYSLRVRGAGEWAVDVDDRFA